MPTRPDNTGWQRLQKLLGPIPYVKNKWDRLQHHFITTDALTKATIEEIAAVPTVGIRTAERLVGRMKEQGVYTPNWSGFQPDPTFPPISTYEPGIVLTNTPQLTTECFSNSYSIFRIWTDMTVTAHGELVGNVPVGFGHWYLMPIQQHQVAHGVGAFYRGCRCSTCTTAGSDAVGIVAARIAGWTLNDIGTLLDLSRERARQLGEKIAPWRPWEAIRQEERAQHALMEEIRTPILYTCYICGHHAQGNPRNRRFCSSDCRRIYDLLRYSIDDDKRLKHRLATAKWAVDNPDKVPDFQLRAAHVLLYNGPDHGSGNRWLVEGSAAFNAAVTACDKAWPVFKQLPSQIRAQIKTHLGLELDDSEAELRDLPDFDDLQDVVTRHFTTHELD